jgi:ABC-2 type transport system ATP-binding protein
MNIIETNDLYKEFYETRGLLDTVVRPFKRGRKKIVLNKINLEVKNNELFCVVGPNGAGKTTLIKILCTLIMPTKGEAFVNGYDIVKQEKKVRENIGFISSDERGFFWRLSGLENLRFFATLYNIPTDMVSGQIEKVIDIASIDEPDKRFQEYSTGARQRLGIARSLLREPQVLFMDEPTKNLDPLMTDEFRRFIKEELIVRHKKTVFFTTHQLSEAETMADRIAILDKGIIKHVGNLTELKKDTGLKDATIEEIFRYYVKQ